MKLPKLTSLIPFLSFFAAAWLLILRVLPFDWLSIAFLIICLMAMLSSADRSNVNPKN
jgi:hypothetical protein